MTLRTQVQILVMAITFSNLFPHCVYLTASSKASSSHTMHIWWGGGYRSVESIKGGGLDFSFASHTSYPHHDVTKILLPKTTKKQNIVTTNAWIIMN